MSDNLQPRGSDDTTFAQPLLTPIKRRSFFMYAGATAGATALVLAGCSKDSNNATPSASLVSVGTGDVAVLNYAYGLEQLEAAFYTMVRSGSYYGGLGANTAEKQILDDLYYHEVIHREFFKAALGSNAIGTLNLNATVVASTLTTRDVILKNAEMFEDLGVAAYNGAGKYLTNPDYLTVAGKIVSVEARHAAAIRDIRESLGVSGGDATGTRFGGDSVVIASGANAGLDVKLEPSAVAGRVISVGIVSDSLSIGTQPPTKAGTPDFGPPSPTP